MKRAISITKLYAITIWRMLFKGFKDISRCRIYNCGRDTSSSALRYYIVINVALDILYIEENVESVVLFIDAIVVTLLTCIIFFCVSIHFRCEVTNTQIGSQEDSKSNDLKGR
jgi:hypothetical protein